MSTRVPSRVIALTLATGALIGGGGALATGATTPESSTPATTPAPTPANPTPPVAVTGGPQSISRTTATLTGQVTPGGAPTTYHFEYGTSSALGLKTPDLTTEAVTTPIDVSAAITGLTVGTTYHYRLVAVNAAGTARGYDKTLTTIANPKAPSVSTQTATGISANAATLVARVNPMGQSTTYYFQYGTSTSYRSKTAVTAAGAGASTVTVSLPISSLGANTKYHYRVVAANATGTVRGSDRTLTTARALTGVTIGLDPATVVWGGSTTVRGTVAGAGFGGLKVTLMRQDFPYTAAPIAAAAQVVSSGGAYSFPVGPLYTSSRIWIATQTAPAVSSQVLAVRGSLLTRLRISKRSKASMQLRGLVYPAIVQGRASLQRKSPKGRWVRVKRPSLKADTAKNRSSYRVTVPRTSRTTKYRVVISPRDAGAHVSTTSKVIVVARRR